jgi:hypothetical protein
MPSSSLGRFKAVITDDERMYAYLRDPLINKAINKVAGASCGKWNKKVSTDKDPKKKLECLEFIDAVGRMERDLNFQKNLYLSFRLGAILGIGYITISVTDTSKSEKDKPSGVEKVLWLTPMSKQKCTVEKTDDNPKSQTFGQPSLYKISQMGSNNLVRTYNIHADRVIPIVPFPFDDGFVGASLIDPIFDNFLIKKDEDWYQAQMMHLNCIPFTELITPEDDVAYQDAINMFPDGLQGKDIFTHTAKEGWEIIRHEIEHPLDPTPYYNHAVDPLCGGLIVPKSLIYGSSEGSTTGSETNLQSFFSDIAALQNNIITPIERDFIKKMHGWGILKEYGWDKDFIPNYDIIWNPAFELSGKELAQQKRLDAIAYVALLKEGAWTPDEVREATGQPAKEDDPEATKLRHPQQAKLSQFGDPEEDPKKGKDPDGEEEKSQEQNELESMKKRVGV